MIDANSCSNTAVMAVQVTSLAPPQIGTVSPLCNNQAAIQLSVNPVGGIFAGNGTSPAGMFTPSVAGAGNHVISYSVTVGPCTSSASRTIFIHSSPTPSFVSAKTFFCKTSPSLFYNANPSGGTFSGPGMTGASFNPANASVGSNTLSYSYTDLNGCTGQAQITVTVSACTGIGEQEKSSILQFGPNPSTGLVHLRSETRVEIAIYNEQGQLMRSETMLDGEMDLQLPAGIYFVRAQTAQESRVQKLIVHD